MKLDLRSQRGITKKTIIIIIVIILFIFFIIGSSSDDKGYELSIENGEEVAYASLRVAIAQSNVDGSGTISRENFDIIKSIVKNANSDNQWFDETTDIYYGEIASTSVQEEIMLTDGTYTATFSIIIENPDSYTDKKLYFTNYSFKEATFEAPSFRVIN